MNAVVPFAVEFVGRELDRANSALLTLIPLAYGRSSNGRLDFQPALGRGRPDDLNDHLRWG